MRQIAKCKICTSELYEKPILAFSDMPKSAQNFPTKRDLDFEKGDELQIFQCSGCGLVQLNSKPVPYYKDVIRAAAYSPAMERFRMVQFKEFLDDYNLFNKKIFEVGCGKGEYLNLMKQCGGDVYGIEHLDESIENCIKSGLSVSKGYIDNKDYKHRNGPFDAFFILNFLEHIPDIPTLLQGICNNIVDDGIGLVEVPNFDMILENNLFSEFISDHLYYFTKDTLIKTLETNGFEVLKCQTIWYNYILSAVVKKRKPLDISNFHSELEKIKQDINVYINKYQNVAIWGAGHQALAIISLTDIKKRIRFVIDSAEFKQGYYTPASHLEIVEPARLSNGYIDAIIVMAASYSDEIADIIKRDYPNIQISILRDFGLEIINHS